MNYYLLIYNRKLGRLVSEPRHFGQMEAEQALAERFKLEQKYASDDDVEVVVLGADSIDSLARTHARYFESIQEITSRA